MKTVNKNVLIGVALFALLLWLWPNLVHEPLHMLALKLQRLPGTIHWDFGFPPHPSTTRLAEISSVPGGLLFLLLPSIFSIFVLAILWTTRRRTTIATHIILPIYLTFDLIVNVVGRTSPTSDFHFLTALPSPIAPIIMLLVAIFGMSIILYGMNSIVEVERCKTI
jgi:hypothetical protein